MRSKTSRSPQVHSLLRAMGFVAVVLSSSCSSGPGRGTLVVNWTVNATKDVALCDQNIGWAVVELKDSYSTVTANYGPCHAFTTEFGTDAGPYTLSAYLLNAGDDTTLSTVAPIAVNLSEGMTTSVSVDFPIAVKEPSP